MRTKDSLSHRQRRRLALILIVLGVTASYAAALSTSADAHAGVGQAPDCTRPYTDASPWNTPIPASATYEANSAARVGAIGGNLSSDPTQFTYPVYYATAATPKRPVTLSGWLSQSSSDGGTFGNTQNATVQVPVPAGAAPASGSDAQVIIIDLSTGDEWGFFNFGAAGAGFQAVNGYRYNVGGNGAPATNANGNGFVARGAGVPYLVGLVRPCEVQRGSIDHALAFAYDAPAGTSVYPAGKSDGSGSGPGALPEGARLQLDSALSDAQIDAWGCAGACLTIAHALQRYGMYVVDNSGRAKVMMEFEGTANWNGLVTAGTASPIPLSAFRVLDLASGAAAPPPSTGTPPEGSPTPPPPAAEKPKKTAAKKKKKKKVKRAAKGSKRLAVGRYNVRGRKLRAGRRFNAIMTLEPAARFRRVPAGLRVNCPARVGNRAVRVLSSKLTRVANGRRVQAACQWSVPPGTRGKRLRASVSVGYKGGETKIRFVGKIHKAR